MFRKKIEAPETPAPQLIERLRAIAVKQPPASYQDCSSRKTRAPRGAVYRQAIATLEGGEQLPVAIRNLSAAGCRIEFYRQTPLTPTLLLEEQSMSISLQAEVVWQGDGAAGLRFASAEGEQD
jgi:hypothetical protein